MNVATISAIRPGLQLCALLLATSALTTAAIAQQASPAGPPTAAPEAQEAPPEEEFEVSAPGGGGSDEIVVIGRRIPNTIRASREVVSVLTQAEIARTGEGDIAGALQRVTGLSVVGGRFVYVRGLGERYSLALLNGLPIPSPDPLRRVVPLDIFPTSILASSVVQKSYSVNFPGEFGGGVINLTTRAIPAESFLTLSGSIGGNTVTTDELGLVYGGGQYDAFGYDDGTRRIPGILQDAQNSGKLLVPGGDFTFRQVQDITASLSNAPTTLIQRNFSIQPNFGFDLAAGHTWDVGDIRFGVVANLGWKNNWQTKNGLQQNSTTFIPASAQGTATLGINQNYEFLATENRAVINGLLGFGMEFGEHRIRINNVYVHDTIKEARLQDGTNDAAFTDVRVNTSNTAWFERQLIQTQAVGEFRFDNISLDIRGTYANSKRLSPYEREIRYAFTTEQGINDFVNDLRSPGQSARVAFSRLNENVYGAGADLGYKLEGGPFPMKFTIGYAYSDNQRSSVRRDYRYQSSNALPLAVAQQRPDFLLSDFNVYTYGITLQESASAGNAPRYDAGLTVHAGYGQVELEPADGVQINGGVRFESGDLFVAPIDIFGGTPPAISTIKENYWLPAATITWNFAEDMQIRASASKTIARPQFRELAPQIYLDTETDRQSRGNQFLVDSELINAELRYEWYFGRDERLSVSGFWKKIDRPIETVVSLVSGAIETTFANAPEAELYGVEADVQKYLPLDFIADGAFFDGRRFLIGVNYTFTNSKIKVAAGDTTIFPSTGQVVPASNFFRDGQPLTGQSDHIANLQLGFSDQDSLSEQTILLNYASNRATSRGPDGQPDLIEKPGLRLDVVLRQGLKLGGIDFELKLEGRNLTNVRYQEFQSLNGSRIDNNTFNLGRSFTAGLSATF